MLPLALWACNSHPLEQPKPAPEEQTDLLYEVNPVRKLDLVFIVDNSSSMTEEQTNLKMNFPSFMSELTQIQGGAPDMRIAVISSNVGAGPTTPAPECNPTGDRGRFIVRPECNLNLANPWLAVDGRGNSNFPGGLTTLNQNFACMAELGTGGCGYEHQLLSLYFALDGQTNEGNKTFIREDAYLGVVILSDEDDCSGEPGADFFASPVAGQAGSLRCSLKGHLCNNQPVPAMAGFSANLSDCKPYVRDDTAEKTSRLINVSTFVDFLKAVKRGRSDKILVSTVIGWDDDATKKYTIVERDGRTPGTRELDTGLVCQNQATGAAYPGIRLHAFAKAFENNTVHSICSANLSQAMTDIGRKLRSILENTCITAPLYDTREAEPGVQADCQVLDQIPLNDGSGRYREETILKCGSGRMPCWELVNDMTCGSRFRTEVRRDQNNPAAPGTLQSIKCLTCPVGSTDPRCVVQP